MRNSVMLFDLMQTPVLSPVPCTTYQTPEFRYGFSLTEYDDKLYLLGGFRGGGYSNSTSDFYQIDVSISNEEASATYSVMESVPLIERGFHTACVATLHAKPTLVVWGGLHHNVAIGALELFDFESKTWRRGRHTLKRSHSCVISCYAGEAHGDEPSPRSGHSCNKMTDAYGNTHLIMVGGSTGGDLLRDGVDLNQIQVLSILTKAEEKSDVMVWTELSLPFLKSSSRGRQRVISGRNHTYVIFERLMIFTRCL